MATRLVRDDANSHPQLLVHDCSIRIHTLEYFEWSVRFNVNAHKDDDNLIGTMIIQLLGHYEDNLIFWERKPFSTCFHHNCLFTGKFSVHLDISYALLDMTFSLSPCLLVNSSLSFPKTSRYKWSLYLCSQRGYTLRHFELCHHHMLQILTYILKASLPWGPGLGLIHPCFHIAYTGTMQSRCSVSAWGRKGGQGERGRTVCASPSPM